MKDGCTPCTNHEKCQVSTSNTSILKDVQVHGDILPNIHKLSYANHDLMKYLEFKMTNNVETVCLLEGGLIDLVPMEWAWG